MKEIVVKIDDDAYRDIKTEMGVRIMMGNTYGPLDEFVILFVKCVEKGLTTFHVTKRKPGEKRTKI